jgi:hypothetical protein
MKGFFCSIIFCLICWSCSKAIEKPEHLLSQNKMEEILTEVYLYQQPSYLTSLQNQPIEYAKVDAQILTKHEVSPKEFEESFRYYVLIPDTFKEILKNVRKNLENKLPEEERLRMQSEKEKIENEKK